MGMTSGQVVNALRDEGYALANRARLTYAIENRYITRPPLDGAHRFVFSQEHLDEFRVYLKQLAVQRPGPRPKRQPEATAA